MVREVDKSKLLGAITRRTNVKLPLDTPDKVVDPIEYQADEAVKKEGDDFWKEDDFRKGVVQQLEAEVDSLRKRVSDLKKAGKGSEARKFYDDNVFQKETELYFLRQGVQ